MRVDAGEIRPHGLVFLAVMAIWVGTIAVLASMADAGLL
jgi:hypothetical protein